MKKLLISLIVVVNLVVIMSLSLFAATTSKLYIHYYRFDNNYSNWNVWLWQYKPTGLDGDSFLFVDDETEEQYNFGGKVLIVDLDETFPDATELGIIIRKGNWEEKDTDMDRFLALGDRVNKHFYFVQGDPLIGTSKDDQDGPSKHHKFTQAQFTDDNIITFQTSKEVTQAAIELYENDVLINDDILNMTIDENQKGGKITLNKNLNYVNQYVIATNFGDQPNKAEANVSFSAMYDKDSFNNMFYTNEDLGAIYEKTKTTFKLWAPLASNVKLNIYQTGTPQALGGSDQKEVFNLTMGAKGVYSIELNGDYHGKYYTYDVTNGNQQAKDIVDPYAKGVGINGLRGLVVDFELTNPEGWDSFSKPNNIENKTDAVIYELHVRDLTTHQSWNGSEENRGLFLGLIEQGTKYNGFSTGFDHVKELGITHLQLLPIFDYGNAIDETKQNDSNYNSFNWGYMPLNFNALEGNYSQDPYDGLKRINEFKQVVMGYGNAGIRINMDVVYNHTGQSADSNFNLIVPGYYHRFNSGGGFSNGSGTGNETASERKMVRKFIVDSVLFWAEQYKLGGFRFDLMALHDVGTMNEISQKLHQMDEKILVYGEPWMGGSSTLPDSLQSGKANLVNLDGIGAFNDDTRDGIKGSVFSSWMPGFIQGDYEQKNKLLYGIVGGINHNGNSSYNVWHSQPDKIINYVTAHDNNTLHDKLYLTLVENNQLSLISQMSLQAHGLILTSQGIPFIHAGDEFLRSKEISSGKFDNNSYQSSDQINQIRWNLKEENNEHYQAFKKLLAIRTENKAFRKSDPEDIKENLTFISKKTKGVIAYAVKGDNKIFIVIVNATNKDYLLKAKNMEFDLLIDTLDINKEEFDNKIGAHSFIVVELKTAAANVSKISISNSEKPLIWIVIGSITGGLAIAAAATLIVLKVIKRKP